MIMKYKVGDRVRVKSRCWYRDNVIAGSVLYGDMAVAFTRSMRRFCGKKATVTDVGEGADVLRGDVRPGQWIFINILIIYSLCRK